MYYHAMTNFDTALEIQKMYVHLVLLLLLCLVLVRVCNISVRHNISIIEEH